MEGDLMLITDLIELGEPDDPLGYTAELLESRFDEQQWRRLMAWMTGQTMCLNAAGKGIIYAHDVERFLRARRIID
jgi:hypothetical protein